MPIISIIHPSRSRIKMATDCYNEWIGKATNKENIQYIFSCDIDDGQLSEYIKFSNKNNIQIVVGQNKNVVQAMNGGAILATGDVIVGVSDDFSCPFEWDKLILENIDTEKEEALAISDGIQPITNTILTLPIITKKLYDKIKFIYYPEYSGIKADDDLAQMCELMGILKRNYNLIFPHHHWINKIRERDEINNRHDNPIGWQIGTQIFEKRKANNFGIYE